MERSLETMRVVNCTSSALGEAVCRLLADYGASVVSVGPLGVGRTPVGPCVPMECIHKLAQGSDVLVAGWTASEARNSGLEYEQLHQLNPRLIYCSLAGVEGAPSDVAHLAVSGIMAATYRRLQNGLGCCVEASQTDRRLAGCGQPRVRLAFR